MDGVRLLNASEATQLRRLEPHLYHLMITGRADPETSSLLEQCVEADAAPEPYALLMEPRGGLRDLSLPVRWRSHRACHLAVVTRSPLVAGAVRAADALSRARGGPAIVSYRYLESAMAAALREVERRR